MENMRQSPYLEQKQEHLKIRLPVNMLDTSALVGKSVSQIVPGSY